MRTLTLLALVAFMATATACCKKDSTVVAPATTAPVTVPATDAHTMTETPPPPPPPPAAGETGGANP